MVHPNYDEPKNKNSYDVNCDWVQSVPGGYVYYGDGIGDAKYFAPSYDYECYYDNLGGGSDSSTPTNNQDTGGGGAVTNWDNIFEDDEPDKVHYFEFKRVPCPGNVVKFPRIAAQKNSGINGGRFGKTRKFKNGNPKQHNGIDIKTNMGDPIYSPFVGEIIAISSDDNAGHIVMMKFKHTDGKYYTMQFFHLDMNRPVVVGQKVNPGDIIGYQGHSGNLGDAVIKKTTVTHVHLKAKVLSTGVAVNPEQFLSTKFETNGNPIPFTDC